MADDDRPTRERLLELLDAERNRRGRVEAHRMRGKHCPIQRPMRDRLF